MSTGHLRQLDARGFGRVKSWVIGRRSILAISLLLCVSFIALYLLLLPDVAYQPWDSLEYAHSTEVMGIRTMRGNHPLGHLILYFAFALAKSLGYEGRALMVLQVVNSLAGGLTIALCFAVLVHRLRAAPLYALGFSIILGASYGFWFHTGTGDIYILSILSCLLTWASFIDEITLRKRTLPVMSGGLAGLSILFHQLNAILILAGMALILLAPQQQNRAAKVQQVTAFLVSAAALVVSGYLLLGFVATSSFSVSRVLGWMQGYFGDPTYGRYLSLEYFFTALGTASQTVMKFSWDMTGFLSYGLLSILVVMMGVGLIANRSLDQRKRAILKVSALQCFATWGLILWWEPQNMKFWMLTLIPWIIFLTLSFEAVESGLRGWQSGFKESLGLAVRLMPLLVGILIFSMNMRSGMWSQHNSRSEDTVAFHQAMDSWLRHSSPNDVLITAGDLVPHLLYWGDRAKTVNLYRSLQAGESSADDFDDLRTEIDRALCNGRTVLLTPAASEYIAEDLLSLVDVSREHLESFFAQYAREGEIVFWYRDLFDGKRVPVYALTGKQAC